MADEFYEFSIIFPFVNPKIWGNLLGKVFMFLMPPLKPGWHRGDLSWDIASFAWLKFSERCDIDAADSCDFKPLGRLSKR
jgi:hypothetical protein